MPRNNSWKCRICLLLCSVLIIAQTGLPQQQPAAGDDTAANNSAPPLKPEELEQILAPLALYPDSLLSQIFMASTYPLEVVQADRWVKANPDLKGDALATELEKQPWDPSVKSLVNFPQVLSMMSEKLDVTIKLGNAFIEQQADVMNTVQKLRAKAQAEGNLKDNEQQKVTVEAAPPPPAQTTVVVQQVPAPPQIITIAPVQPDLIYVPVYNPVVVYGAWPYPAYPPYPYYPPRPPGYVASNLISFGVGVACGAAWGYAWGNCNWGSHSVKINYNQNININNNINRAKYQNNIQNNGNWQHNPAHRDGVPYRDRATNQKYGQLNQSRQATQARDAYRGRAEAGRQDIARGGADQFRGNNPGAAVGRNGGGVQNRPGAGGGGVQNRNGAGIQSRPGAGGGGIQDRPASPANRASGNSGAFGNIDRGGAGARMDSQRGQSSRAASPSARPAPSRSAGGGGGGGAGRAGGRR